MGVGRFSRPGSGVGMLAMQDARLDPMRQIESDCNDPPGAGVLQLLICGIVVGVIIDHSSAVDGVTVTH